MTHDDPAPDHPAPDHPAPDHPGAVGVDDHWRLEGPSGAADLLLVLATTCPSCGTRGTVVLGYGPNADAADTH